MMSQDSLSFDRVVAHRGSGGLLAIGIAILLLGISIGVTFHSLEAVIGTTVLGMVSIIASFLFVIKQYERSVILRLGKFNRQLGRIEN